MTSESVLALREKALEAVVRKISGYVTGESWHATNAHAVIALCSAYHVLCAQVQEARTPLVNFAQFFEEAEELLLRIKSRAADGLADPDQAAGSLMMIEQIVGLILEGVERTKGGGA